jgi:predicted Zn finger-like uncharacterized protein
MIVECTGCDTIFPVDPQKVPSGGVHARCSVCHEVFFVNVPEPEATFEEAEAGLEAADATLEESEADFEEDTPAFGGEEETEAAVEEAAEGFEEEVEAFVMETEPTFEETVATFEEAETAIAETEPTFEETVATFEEAETAIEDAEETYEVAGTAIEDAVATFEEAETAIGEAEETFDNSAAEVMDAVEEAPEPPPVSAPLFGRRDPAEKAQRLARVLVSDIILYNPDRHHIASESGRVKEEFEEEIQKSWNEYVEQVGEDVANRTSFFNDALNEILAQGEQIF